MAHTKQTKWRDESKQLKLPRQPSKWGTAASGVTHRPPVLPARTDNTLGIPLTKVCLECIHCNLKEYTGRRCRRLNYTYNTYTCNRLNNLNDTHVGGVRDLTVQVL